MRVCYQIVTVKRDEFEILCLYGKNCPGKHSSMPRPFFWDSNFIFSEICVSDGISVNREGFNQDGFSLKHRLRTNLVVIVFLRIVSFIRIESFPFLGFANFTCGFKMTFFFGTLEIFSLPSLSSRNVIVISLIIIAYHPPPL